MVGDDGACAGSRLEALLTRLDGRGYKAFKELRGTYAFDGLTLHVDHVQGDPFAEPSKLRLSVPAAVGGFPEDLWSTRVRRVALQDYIARRARAALAASSRPGRGSGRSGEVRVDAGGQEVLERTAVVVGRDGVELRLQVGLPAAGRRILGREAGELLCRDLPRAARRTLLWSATPPTEARRFVEVVENQEHVRSLLPQLGLVAFVGDGALLPRESGVSDRPLCGDAVPWTSPPSLAVAVDVPNDADGTGRRWTGTGIRRGVTLVVGGGYHGKSTLLDALKRCVYPHVPGDGRERVVTAPGAVAVRAEDGRRVEGVDISPFISGLPGGRGTSRFSSEDASGSTSQAASIVEALEVGADVLLLDEDTSATNFMVRDARMQALVAKDDEPITPLVDRVRELAGRGVSTVIVMGGCGDYFDVADTVLLMRAYVPQDVGERARAVAAERPTQRLAEVASPLGPPRSRRPVAATFDASRGRRDMKIEVRALDRLVFGRHEIDLRGVEQVVDASQTRAIGHGIHLAARRLMGEGASLREVVERLESLVEEEGLDVLRLHGGPGEHPGNLARARTQELAAAINRLRTLRVQ